MMWLLSAVLALCCVAQDEPPKERKPGWLLYDVFPNPTGDNGFEDLLIAAEALEKDPAWQRFSTLSAEEEDTLADQRRVVAACKPVLVMIRMALARTRWALPEPGAWDDPNTKLAYLRGLSWLLNTEMQVHFAGGSEMLAIRSFEDCFALGHRLHGTDLMSVVVGGSIRHSALKRIGRHLEQLDYDECKHLRKVSEKLLQQDYDLRQAIVNEFRMLDAFLAQPPSGGIVQLLDDAIALFNIRDEDWDELREVLVARPELGQEALDRVRLLLREYRNQLLAALEKPPSERVFPSLDQFDDGSWAWYLLQKLIGVLPGPAEAALEFSENRARLQLLAVHAAILEYRWWYGSTPVDLGALKLGNLVTDPLTERPFVYKRLGEYRYRLYSAGSNKRDDDGDPWSDVVLTTAGG